MWPRLSIDPGVALASDSQEPQPLSSTLFCKQPDILSLLSALPALGTHAGQKTPRGKLELDLNCGGW